MADPDLKLKGGGGGVVLSVLLALPAFFFISFFFTPSNGEGASPRSATGESLTVPLDCTGRVESERIRGLSGLGLGVE